MAPYLVGTLGTGAALHAAYAGAGPGRGRALCRWPRLLSLATLATAAEAHAQVTCQNCRAVLVSDAGRIGRRS